MRPLLLAIMLFGLLGTTACAESAGEPQPGRSTASKLYTLDEGSEPRGEGDPALARYTRYLRKLDRGCTETEEELGDLTLTATELVNEQSQLAEPYKLIHLLEPAAAGVGTDPADCTELFALVGFGLLAQER